MSFTKSALALVALIASAQATLTSDGVLKEIAAKGAKPFIADQFHGSDESRWDKLLDKIESGTPGWLEVAEKLKPGVDGSSGEGLTIALAVALTHNPEGVLKMTPVDRLEGVCTVPFIEASDAKANAHIRRVRLALKKVTSPDLQEKRDKCRAFIDGDAKK